jgi:hypothetical protein
MRPADGRGDSRRSGDSPPPPRSFAGATAKAVAVAVLEAEGGRGTRRRRGAGCVSAPPSTPPDLGKRACSAPKGALRYGTPYVQD